MTDHSKATICSMAMKPTIKRKVGYSMTDDEALEA